jgi:hypothetical protein
MNTTNANEDARVTATDRGSEQDAAHESPSADDGAYFYDEVTPVSLAIAMAGAVVMLIAVFLPRVESNTFGGVAENTLIQSGDGWFFIGLAVGIAGWSWRAYHRQRRTLGPVILGLIAIGVAIYDVTNRNSLRLCPVDPSLGGSCSQATASIGIYAAGVGGLLALIGGWQIWRAKQLEQATSDVWDDLPAEETARPNLRQRLATLESLRADALITESEYTERRKALLDDL